jgi:stress response protein YsnF
MANPDIDTALRWRGRTVVDRDGEKIGSFDEVYLDHADRPAWAAVTTGLFGRRQTFVPLSTADEAGDSLRVPFEQEHVKAAPSIDPDEQLTPDQEDELYRHYGIADDDVDRGDAEPPAAGQRPESAPGPDRPAAEREDEPDRPAAAGAHDERDTAMTRSEEELVVGTRRRVRGRARLKKYVVTEHVQRTIPVQREEVRVEYDPADGPEPAPDDEADSRASD